MSLNTVDTIHKANIIKNMKLRLVTELPSKYQHLFSAYPCFNGLQSHVMDDILYTDESIVVASPTGSGKTVLFEFAVIHLLEQMQSQGKHDSKILYMAPLKALCTERFLDWSKRFSSLGLKCVELTGDSDVSELNSAYNYQLILTTPEKWDSLTRKWRDHENFIKSVKLFLIDEAHILNEEKRGATLEAVVTRMKLLNQCRNPSKNKQYIRFIALSATITNIQDIAVWLGRTQNSPATFKRIGDEMRPVNLHKIVKGYTFKDKQSQYRFDINLSYKIKEILFEYSEGKPTLIFCSTRNGVQQTSTVLFKELSFSFTEEQKQKLIEVSSKLTDSKLSELVMSGIGYHHAGMLLNDKRYVMELFQSGYLPILVATSTLAMGVNLPAHLVIVKSTQHYVDGTFKEYSEVQLLQMIGRAGRPQFDTSATAVIMTADTTKAKYERLISGVELIESSLHRHLAEYLNAEIVLGTITDVPVAMDWIRSTFLYIRASVNPKHYGIPPGLSKEAFEGKLQDMCMRELNSLVRNNLVIIKNGYDIQTNENGMLMAHYCISLETMKIFMQLKGTESIEDMISLLSHAYEFSDIKLRVNEKSVLNYMNRNNSGESIRFPLKGRISTKFMKINCLIQSLLSCLPINDISLNQEAVRIIRLSQRLMKAFSSYIWRQSHYKSLVSSTILTKCLECKLWENSPYIVRQLPGIGPALASLLVAAGKTTFKALVEANPRDLERILNRHPPFGNHLQESVWRIPQYKLEMVLLPPSAVTVTVTLVNADEASLDDECKNWRISLLVGDSRNRILHKEKILNSGLLMRNSVYTLTVPMTDNTDCTYIEADLISDTWVGIDKKVIVQLSQQRKTFVQIQKEDKAGIKINSQQTTKRHFVISEEMKMKCCTPDLQLYSFTPRKSIQHSTLNSCKLLHDPKAEKTNSDLNNSNFLEESQQHVNGEDFENKNTNFVNIDDLLDYNLTNKNVLPTPNILSSSPVSQFLYVPSKTSVSFLSKNMCSSFKKDSLNFENALPVSVNKLLEKRDKIFAKDENKNPICPSKLLCKQDLQTDSIFSLKNIFSVSANKLLEDQHKICASNIHEKPTCSSKLSCQQDLQSESFFNMKSTLLVSANELLGNQQKKCTENIKNNNPICVSKQSCERDLKIEAFLSNKNALPVSTNKLLEDQHKIFARNINKNLIHPAKLLLKKNFKTEPIFSQKHIFPTSINNLSQSPQGINARNENVNSSNPSKPSTEGNLKTEVVLSQKNSPQISSSKLLKSPHEVCAEDENISPSNSLFERELKTEKFSQMKQLEIKLDPTICTDLIPENIHECSQVQIKQTRHLYHPVFLSLNEIHSENEHKEVNVTLTSDVNNCSKQKQRKYNSGNLVNTKSDKKDSFNCMQLSVNSNSKVPDENCEHCKSCSNNTEKQQRMPSCNNLSKNELGTDCLNEMQLCETNNSGNNMNDEKESEKECSNYSGFINENTCNDMDDTTFGEKFSNNTDMQKGNISYDHINCTKKIKGPCLSGIDTSVSDKEKDNLSLHKTNRNFEDIKQVEKINIQGNKHSSTLLHQSVVSIRQEKYLCQSGIHSSMFVSSTMKTKLNRKYELGMQKLLFQTHNTTESKQKIYETPIIGKNKTTCENYTTKNIILPSELTTNTLNNNNADKNVVFHSEFIPGSPTQKSQQVTQHIENTRDLNRTEENCFPSNVSNYEAEMDTLDTTDKIQPSSATQRHFEYMLKDRPCHNNDASFSQKGAFLELYGNMNYQDCKIPVSKNMCDSYSSPLFSNSTQPPNLVYKSITDKEVQKSGRLFSDQTNDLLDFNLSQISAKHSANCGENVYRNNKVLIKKKLSETANSKQFSDWLCGNNFSNKYFNSSQGLCKNQMEINGEMNRDNMYTTSVGKFCKKSPSFNIHSQSHDLYKTENDYIQCQIPKKKIKFENNDNLCNTTYDTCITNQ